MSARCVAISNPDSFSNREIVVNAGIRSFRKPYLNELDVRKPLLESILQRREELHSIQYK
jgi:hypothetical protein